MIGYGSQGHGQSLNARDNGLNVIVGVRKGGESWKQAQEDGWVPGETLFDIPEAIQKGTIIMNLLSDAAQSSTWPEIAPLITKGKTLYFAHGFSVVYKEDVSIVALPPRQASVDLRFRPRSFPPRMSTSSSSPPRARAVPSAPSSSRAAASTRPSPSTRT
jgi:ketol-acid reductoisomerase